MSGDPQNAADPRAFRVTWWAFAATGSLLLVLNTTLLGYLPDFPQKWRLMLPFSLATEMNPAVWWSAMGLLLVSLLSYEAYCARESRFPSAWLALAFYAALLTIDEIGSIHERLPDWLNMILAVPFAALALYAVAQTWRDPQSRPAAFALVGANVMFVFVIVMEDLQFRLQWAPEIRSIRTGIEEGAELLGIFLLLWAVIRHGRSKRGHDGIAALVPNPGAMRGVIEILSLGFLGHLLISLLMLPRLNDLAEMGDPSAVFPTVCYMILFTSAYRWQATVNGPSAKWGILLAAACLLSSIGSMYGIYYLVPKLTTVIPEHLLLDPYFVSTSQCAVVLLAALAGSGPRLSRDRLLLLTVALAASAIAVSSGCRLDYALRGLLPFLLATLLVPEAPEAHADGRLVLAGLEPL